MSAHAWKARRAMRTHDPSDLLAWLERENIRIRFEFHFVPTDRSTDEPEETDR